MLKKFTYTTKTRLEMIDVTADVAQAVSDFGVNYGLVYVFSPHTAAAVTVMEATDPNLKKDLNHALSKLFPYKDPDYTHLGNNADAHLKVATLGAGQTLIIDNGHIILGEWQGIYLCELDGPRQREIYIKVAQGM
ncbi:MAG: YjbQ family protein [Deltaproteobacteria bacterium]|nr:YjbQ family protein [Deltaproteobacteria bacterium]